MSAAQFPTPPTTRSARSVASRRRELNMSDESETSTTRAGRRVGWPALVELPVAKKTVHSHYDHFPVDTIINWVMSHMIGKNMDCRDVTICNRVDALNREDPGIPTLLVLAAFTDTTDDFYLLLDAIKDFFISEGITGLAVEIADPSVFRFRPKLSLEPSHEAYVYWAEIHREVVKILGTLPWSVLSLVRREAVERGAGAKPTILIETPHPKQVTCTTEILDFCRRGGIADMVVEVTRIKDIFAVDSTRTTPLAFEKNPLGLKDFKDDLHMGCSLAPKYCSDSTGTLGGFMILRKNQQRIKVASTNHHVLRLGVIDNALHESGVTPDQSKNLGPFWVDSPSAQDKARFCRSVDHLIERYTNSMENIYKTCGVTDPSDPEQIAMMGPAKQGRAEGFQNDIINLNRQKVDVSNFDSTVGPIWASSGVRTCGPNQEFVDWGLVQVASRQTYNLLPTLDYFQSLGLHHNFPEYRPLSKHCRTWKSSHVQRSENVLKVGRSTKLTTGELFGLYSVVKLTGLQTAIAWRINSVNQDPFCLSGDSGSWVIDQEGSLCGLLFAELEANDGLMVAVGTLVEDIEKVTGWKVDEPRRDTSS